MQFSSILIYLVPILIYQSEEDSNLLDYLTINIYFAYLLFRPLRNLFKSLLTTFIT